MPRGRKNPAPETKTQSKSKATAKAKAPTSALAALMQSVTAKAKAKKIDVVDADGLDNLIGVKFYISTGLPSLDLNLIQSDEIVEEGVSPYGWPTGRIVEISGKENSYKSWFLHDASAEVCKKGGLVFQVYTEADFDIRFFKYFYEKRGLDFQKDVLPRTRMSMATTVEDVVTNISFFLTELREYYENGGEPVPAIITVDSIGALLGTTNHARMEKGDGDQVGSHAKELHDFFKRVKNDCARYNVLLMFSNHTRANLGGGYSGENSAHESAVKYYASFRLYLSADKSGDKTSKYSMDYQKNRKVRCQVKKVKGQFVGNGRFELMAQPNIGFDYLGSLIEACRMTILFAKKTNGSFEYKGGDNPNKYTQAIEEILGEETKWSGEEALRKYLKSNLKLVVLLEKACYAIGPFTLKDDDADLVSEVADHLANDDDNDELFDELETSLGD